MSNATRAGTHRREPRSLVTRPGTSCTMTISLSATFGAFRSLQTFLTTMPSLSASLSALDRTRCAWPMVRGARPF